MHCKQGDLAVIVSSSAGNDGKFVTCLRLIPSMPMLMPNGRTVRTDCWLVDARLMGCKGQVDSFVADAQLRPIRDIEGEDEMLRIAGLPKPVVERA